MEDKAIQKQRRERQKLEDKADYKNAANLANAIGAQLSQLGRFEDAIGEHKHELFLCETVNDVIGIAVAYRKIGECYADLGKFDQALEYENMYLKISQQEGNQEEIQRALATLGRTYLCQAEALEDHRAMRHALTKARKAFVQSLDASEKLRKEVPAIELANMKARLCLNMGLVYDKQYNLKKAVECFNRGISLSLDHKLPDIVFMCRKCQAGAFQKLGDLGNSIKVFDAALKYAESVKDRLSQAEILTQKALIYLHLKDMFAAKRSIKKAYKLKAGGEFEQEKIATTFKRVILTERLIEDLKELPETADGERRDVFEKLGDNAAELENFRQAIDFYKEMLSCALREGKSGLELEKIYESIACTYHDAAEFSESILYYQKKLECVQDDDEKTVKTYLSMADTMEVAGEIYEKIEETYMAALQRAKSSSDARLQTRVLKGLAAVQSAYKRIDSKDETDEELRLLQTEHNIESEDEMSEARDSQGVLDSLEDINLQDFLSEDDDSDDEEFDRAKSVSSAGRVARRKTKNQFKRNEKGEYPLHTACIDGELEKARVLISQGHPINPRDHCGWLPLHEASNHNYAEIVDLLLSHGAWINDRGGQLCQGITPLHDACSNGCLDVVELLVSKGANIHAKNDEGETALGCLIAYRKSSEGLSGEELLRLKSVEAFLKDTMKGNNPHLSQSLSGRSRLSAPYTVDDEEELPTIRHRQKTRVDREVRSSALSALQSTDSTSANGLDHEDDLEETVIREYEESQDKRDKRSSLSSLSGKRRRSTMEEGGDSDYEDRSTYLSSTQHKTSTQSFGKSSSAKDIYQETIASMRRSAVSSQTNYVRSLKLKSQKGRALVSDNEFIGDDWLIDDVGDQRKPSKRKRTDVDDILHTTGTRRSDEGINRRSFSGLSDTDDEEVEAVPSPVINKKSAKRNSSEGDTSRRILIQDDSSNDLDPVLQSLDDDDPAWMDHSQDFVDNIPSQFIDSFTSQDFHLPPVQSAHFPTPPPPRPTAPPPPPPSTQRQPPAKTTLSMFSSNHSKPRQTKLTTFGLTKTNITPAAPVPSLVPTPEIVRPRMRLKVKIKDKCILLAVTSPEEPISWLIDLAADRYYKLYGMRPLLSLATSDGAVLSPEDPISFLLSNDEEVEGLVESWNLPPLPERYKDACTSLKTVVYRNVKSLLSNATGSHSLVLSNLALASAQFLPVSKALQCQNSLKEIHLNGNRLGDTGFSSLCKVLHTLPSLRTLNVSSNQISGTGLRALATVMEQPEKPLQVLEAVDLSYNPLADSSTQTLAVIIRHLSALVKLNLASCDLTVKFFQQHRIQLAEALQGSSVHDLNIAYNHLGCTGVELLLKCVRVSTLGRLNLTGVVNTYTTNNIPRHLLAYTLNQECVLNILTLDNCYIHQELWADIVSIVSQCKSLESLSLSANPKIDNNDVQELLEAASRYESGKLSSILLNGCSLASPFSTCFLDGMNDKLNHNYPLQHLEFTSKSVNKMDCDALRDIWVARWSDQAKVDTAPFRIILSTTVMKDQLL